MKYECTISIIETDGELSVTGDIPGSAAGSIAEMITLQMLRAAQIVMNSVTGQNAQMHEYVTGEGKAN